MKESKYVVLNPHTHCEYLSDTSTVFCTHGGWEAPITFNEDGTCSIRVRKDFNPKYESYFFTDAKSIDECIERGLVTIKRSSEI